MPFSGRASEERLCVIRETDLKRCFMKGNSRRRIRRGIPWKVGNILLPNWGSVSTFSSTVTDEVQNIGGSLLPVNIL